MRKGACALDAAGKAHCWGEPGGEYNDDPPFAPVPLRGDLLFSSIAVGSFQSCGLSTNGLQATYCWAHNGTSMPGMLGTDDDQSYRGPVPVANP